jgi:hypothetical protein
LRPLRRLRTRFERPSRQSVIDMEKPLPCLELATSRQISRETSPQLCCCCCGAQSRDVYPSRVGIMKWMKRTPNLRCHATFRPGRDGATNEARRVRNHSQWGAFGGAIFGGAFFPRSRAGAPSACAHPSTTRTLWRGYSQVPPPVEAIVAPIALPRP